MKKVILSTVFILLAMSLQSCCIFGGPMREYRFSPPVEHVVFVWLKEGYTEKGLELVIRESKALSSIPGIVDMKVGKALASDRAIVDDSFQVGIIMSFNSAVEMKSYLTHPDHVRRVKETLKPMSSKIVVYDIIPE